MRALRAERVECLALVQDLGRPGLAHLGVPGSGALDKAALALGNRLVGNAEGAAGLEVLLGGLVLVAEESLRVALTGAQLPLWTGSVPAPWGAPVSVAAGERIRIGRSRAGLRSWLAVAGGIAVPPTLGSRSTDTLSGLGPPPVAAGDLLPVGPAVEDLAAAEAVPARRSDGVAVLGLRLGPRDDWFTPESLAVLVREPYEVSQSADRVGIRLRGEALVRCRDGELPSEGLVTGAVQIPGDGQPLVFLADHPTTGGYPVVGVVSVTDLPLCAQLRPGDLVRFHVAGWAVLR